MFTWAWKFIARPDFFTLSYTVFAAVCRKRVVTVPVSSLNSSPTGYRTKWVLTPFRPVTIHCKRRMKFPSAFQDSQSTIILLPRLQITICFVKCQVTFLGRTKQNVVGHTKKQKQVKQNWNKIKAYKHFAIKTNYILLIWYALNVLYRS
mgnify:CR=1 FL=1